MASLKGSLLTFCLGLILFQLSAQKIPLIHSGDVISQGIVLYDSGKFEDAIKLFETVPERDTNYVYMLSELALAYVGAEKYDKAIESCKLALKEHSEHRSNLFRTLGTALDRKGDFEKSVEIFSKGLEEYPFDHVMHYNLGVTYYNHKDYDNAKTCFFRALKINPFHAGSHLNLGMLSALQGRKVRAMLSFGVYLSIANRDNGRLVFLERYLNNEFPEDGSLTSNDPNPFEKLDQIIRAKIVSDKNFKAKVPINAILVKQYQILLDQLALTDPSVTDFWTEFYLPLYQQIQSGKHLEPFLYHILTSSNNADVLKWRKKNQKTLDGFFALANVNLKANRATRTVPDSWGIKNPAPCWYTSDHFLEAIGHEDASGNRLGKWLYFATNGAKIAEGEYTEGKKSGVWHYYAENGRIKSIENYDNGEYRTFTKQGEPLHHYFLKDDKVDGTVEIFYPCGKVKEKLSYKGGNRHGPGKTYYVDGAVEVEYDYKDNKLTGSYIVYYNDGALQKKYMYADDELVGQYVEYYNDGQIKTRGNYIDGVADGLWEYFYANGTLFKSGKFTGGELTGEWTFFDSQGRLMEKQIYDEKGELHGEDIIYHKGRKTFIHYYEHGLRTAVAYFDAGGKEIHRSGHASGTFPVKGYYPDGKLYYEGAYKKGLANGEWTYYYREGMVNTRYTYVDDTLHGKYMEYFKSGDVKIEKEFKDGEYNGYFREYYIHGQVKEEGWLQHDNREQQWLAYHPDGTLESDNYYLNGQFSGATFDYNNDGKLYSRFDYQDGRIVLLEYYDRNGKVRQGGKLSGEKEIIEQKFSSGKSHSRVEMTCGDYTGDIVTWYPDGKNNSIIRVSGGRRHGVYESFHVNGVKESEGEYVYGDRVGKWTWNHMSGTPYCEGYYLAGERDSVWTYYTEDGSVSTINRFAEDERDGIIQEYSPEGVLIVEKRFEAGDMVAYRALAGERMSDWIAFTGNHVIKATFDNGNNAYEETYKNGLLQGRQLTYFMSGQLYSEIEFEKGDYTNNFNVYYPNGKVRSRGKYKYDEFDGLLEHFNEDGTLAYTEVFTIGARSGPLTIYKNNRKEKEVNYWAGTIIE